MNKSISVAVPTLSEDWLASRRASLIAAVAGTRRRPLRTRRALVIVASGTAALIAAGSGLAVGLSHLWSEPPRPLSQPLNVASTNEGDLQAWLSDRGICLGIVDQGAMLANGCGFPVHDAPPDQVGQGSDDGDIAPMTASSGSGTFYIAGVVAPDVSTVAVKLTDGTTITPSIYPAPASLQTPVKLFFASLALNGRDPDQVIQSYVALDSSGSVIATYSGR